MGIRPKLFLIFFILGIAPMLLLSVLLYWNGVRSVETLMRSDLEPDAAGIAREVETGLLSREAALIAVTRSPVWRDYVRGENPARIPISRKQNPINSRVVSSIPTDVETEVRSLFVANPRRYASLTCLDATRRPLFRAEPTAQKGELPGEDGVLFQTQDFLSTAINPDARVWTTADQAPIRATVTREPLGPRLRYTIPVFTKEGGAPAPRGALIAELNSDELFEEVVTGRTEQTLGLFRSSESSAPRFLIMLDRAGYIVYHTNEALRHQPVDSAMPLFKDISAAMMSDESGWQYYDTENTRWLVAYRPVPALGLAVAVGGNHTLAVQSVERLGWIGLILSALFGLLTAAILTQVVRRTARSIERVTEGAVAIAHGKLDQRIEVRSSDETRLLAESFNIMTDRLREQIARETESRQFESFMRLSAMLTHDLKNAIASLSLLVGNMERQFHREEFRADAMKSLTEATNKLRTLVTKLSEPMQSLSSEHQMPRPTDLVPIIGRVLEATVEPVRTLHRIEVRLPESLVATVEADRIEKVFENLIINALEAMGSASGQLTLEAGPTAHGEVFISISDTGPGMTEEFKRTKLFRAFATTKKRGVGLGLYACREIIRAHGGHIDVESEQGSGTTFRVVLPSAHKITGRT